MWWTIPVTLNSGLVSIVVNYTHIHNSLYNNYISTFCWLVTRIKTNSNPHWATILRFPCQWPVPFSSELSGSWILWPSLWSLCASLYCGVFDPANGHKVGNVLLLKYHISSSCPPCSSCLELFFHVRSARRSQMLPWTLSLPLSLFLYCSRLMWSAYQYLESYVFSASVLLVVC